MSLIISQSDKEILDRYGIKNFMQLRAACTDKRTANPDLLRIFLNSVQAIGASFT